MVQAAIREWSGNSQHGKNWHVYQGDALSVLKELPDNTYNCVVTSPPYFWLRDYKVEGQVGQEDTIDEYVQVISSIMDEVRRVLTEDGLLFLNIGDTYYSGKGQSQGKDPKSNKRRFGLRAVDKSGGMGIGLERKTLIGVPWRVANEMTLRNWVLRSSIIWHGKQGLNEAVIDRPRRSYEFIFMFAKSRYYYFNRSALAAQKVTIGQEDQGFSQGEDVWNIVARPKVANGLETAPFPDELVQRCLDIGCPPEGHVLDPFAGGGTTLRVALQSGRTTTGIELNPQFCSYIVDQIQGI